MRKINAMIEIMMIDDENPSGDQRYDYNHDDGADDDDVDFDDYIDAEEDDHD